MLTRKIRIRILVALNIVTAIWLCAPDEGPSRGLRMALSAPPSGSSLVLPTAADGAPADAPSFRPKSGMHYLYSFDRKIDIHGLGSNLPPIAFHGTFAVDVTHADGRGFEAVAEEQVLDAPGPGARFRLHLDASGGAMTLAGDTPSSELERQHVAILKDLLANWVFASSTDTVGRYTSIVKRIPDVTGPRGVVSRFTKRKLAYVEARDPIPTIARSLHVMEWSPALGMPLDIKGMESTQLGTGKLGLESDAQYALRFVRVEPSTIGSTNLAGLDHPETLALNASPSHGGQRGINRPIPDWSSLARRIGGVASLTSSQQLELFGDLVANLRATSGQSLSDLVALLSPGVVQAGPSSALFKLAVGALATAASPEAQAALVSLYQDPNCSIDGKGTILAAFTTTQAPLNVETREFLTTESQGAQNQDLADGAAFALGASLQNAPNDATTTKAITQIQQAWNEESAAGSKFQEMSLMDVMGNSGRTDFLPDLTGVIDTSTDPTLRAKAVYDLRFMQSSDAVSLLDQSLSDPTPGVRQAAANAMETAPWNQSFVAPLNRCVAGEQVAEIQKTCQQALARAPQ